MRSLPVIVCLALAFLSAVHAGPAEPNKSHSAATVKPVFRFHSYDGNPAKPKEITFAVTCSGLRQPKQFPKLGETIPGTKYEVTKFEFKTRPHPEVGEEDISVLTLVHTETKETIILILGAR